MQFAIYENKIVIVLESNFDDADIEHDNGKTETVSIDQLKFI